MSEPPATAGMLLACDPGLHGAFALFDGDDLRIFDMPIFKQKVGRAERSMFDEEATAQILAEAMLLGCGRFVIEKVNGAGGQSAPAAFTFGYQAGFIVACARAQGMRIDRVPANVWKPALRCPSDKRASRARASEIMPQYAPLWPRQKDDGRAEAAMIGWWAMHNAL